MPNNKLTVAYIDDDPVQIRAFQRSATENFEVVKIPLKKNLDDVVSEVFKKKVDALVIDYNLREGNSHINYQGDDIFKKVNEKVENFPMFILTSHVNDAERQSIDINVIYDRDKENEDADKKFFKRVRRQIENYQAKIKTTEIEFNKLKARKTRNLIQEERMLELDSTIERSLNKNSQLPKSLKKTTDLKKLGELIGETEKLIEEIKKNEKKKKSSSRKSS